jgi:F-type H+-transporting ATPase subunit gamma
MASLRDIKKRIQSIENIEKITKAMKMVSAAKLRQAMKRMQQCMTYTNKIKQTMSNIIESMSAEDFHNNPIFQTHHENSLIKIISVTSDRGMCGSFNNSVVRVLENTIAELQSKNKFVSVINLGKKSKKKPITLEKDFFYNIKDSWNSDILNLSETLADKFLDDYQKGLMHSLYTISNCYKSASIQQVEQKKLLPLDTNTSEVSDDGIEYIFEPSKINVLNSLIPKYLTMCIYQSFLESETSEHSARMRAMDSATKNANETFSLLTLQYNRARQANITKELMEIISGAEALK